ncbi:MAG: hypothetical protein QM497_11060 [Sulfurimonas sp.]
MRSRDGDSAFLRRLFSLILFSSLALNAGEYLISYRYIIKDAVLYNETLLISKSMQKCKGTPQDNLLLESNGSTDIEKIISKHKEKFISFIHKLGLHLEHKEKNINYQNSFTTILTLKTTCFKVDFNDNFAKLSPLK